MQREKAIEHSIMDGAKNADFSLKNFTEREESCYQIVPSIIGSSIYKASYDSLKNISRYS